MIRQYPTSFLIGTIVLAFSALSVRLWGVAWSLPYVDHPDEPAIVDVLLRMLGGDLNPRHFFYPSLILYLQTIVFWFHFHIGTLLGWYPESFVLPHSNHFYTTIPDAFIWGRAFTALLSSATVMVMVWWASRYIGRTAAILGALFLAYAPWAVVHAHYLTVDAPAAFFAIVALLAMMHLVRDGRWHAYVIAGVFLGLAAGSKYQNALLVISFLLAHSYRVWQSDPRPFCILMGLGDRRLIGAGLTTLLVFFSTSPYILLDSGRFIATMHTLVESYDGSHGDIQHTWPVGDYLWFHWHEALQPIPFLLMLLGAYILFRRSPVDALILLSFPFVLMLTLLRMETHFYRNLLPAHPPLFLFAGIGAAALLERLMHWATIRSTSASGQVILGAVLIIGMIAPSLVGTLQSSARLAQPDSRVAAQEWARVQFPGVRIAAEQSHPMQWHGISQATPVYYLPLRSMEWYREQGYGLLMANDGRRKRTAWTPDYDSLLGEGQVIATFGGREPGYLGPQIDLIETHLSRESLSHPVPITTTIGPLHMVSVLSGTLQRSARGEEVIFGDMPRPGETLSLVIAWIVSEPVNEAPHMLFLHMRNAQGVTVVQRDAPPWHGLFPLSTWPIDTLVVERIDLLLPEDLPSGSYELFLGLYDGATLERFPALLGTDRVPHDEIGIGLLLIE